VAPDHVTWLGGSADTFWNNLSDDLKRRLLALIAEEVPDAAGTIPVEIEAGYVAHTILRKIDKDHFDLVVMGTHGRTGLSHVLMGSVAERVVRLSPVPVMTVRVPKKSKKAARETAATGAGDPTSSEAAPTPGE
jgi:nucleotide-binding universal stress UspA family protein